LRSGCLVGLVAVLAFGGAGCGSKEAEHPATVKVVTVYAAAVSG
jgi:hypothetical protein